MQISVNAAYIENFNKGLNHLIQPTKPRVEVKGTTQQQ